MSVSYKNEEFCESQSQHYKSGEDDPKLSNKLNAERTPDAGDNSAASSLHIFTLSFDTLL